MILPCKHERAVTSQVEPAIDLLSNMDRHHPDILRQHRIEPNDYKKGLVFRSAIESIRGTFISSQTTGREGLVQDVLENLHRRRKIYKYQKCSSRERYDFEIQIENNPDYYAAIEVKGGEGNSINISQRPVWAREFCVWSHLDGAIINEPANGAHSIVNRLTNELVRREKQVDVLFFKDVLCGSRTRPCPKYPENESTIGLNCAPDVFLFPQSVPTLRNPEPPLHTLETLKMPKLILKLFNVRTRDFKNHVWEVQVKLIQQEQNKFRREVKIFHKDTIVDQSISRSWRLSRDAV